jgi:hypothetical protein
MTTRSHEQPASTQFKAGPFLQMLRSFPPIRFAFSFSKLGRDGGVIRRKEAKLDCSGPRLRVRLPLDGAENGMVHGMLNPSTVSRENDKDQ